MQYKYSINNQVPPTRLICMRTSVTRGPILIFKMYDLVILFIILTFKISYILFFLFS
jgi:hypothetical protein